MESVIEIIFWPDRGKFANSLQCKSQLISPAACHIFLAVPGSFQVLFSGVACNGSGIEGNTTLVVYNIKMRTMKLILGSIRSMMCIV